MDSAVRRPKKLAAMVGLALLCLAQTALNWRQTVLTGVEKDGLRPFDELKPDAAWCGPRIVYFFAWFLGQHPSLDEVVIRCGTDSEGFTSLANLVAVTDELGLEPT